MIYRKIIFFIYLIFSISPSAFAQSSHNQLSGLLQNLETFQANFSQVIQDKRGNPLSQSSGKMALKRPGLFRWETTTPNQQLIIADGKTIWIYDKDLEQVSKQKQNISTNTPGLLLSDSASKLLSRFSVKLENENTFKLTPKGKKDLFQYIELIFDGNNALNQMILYDNLGQTTEITFSNIKQNPTLSVDLFQFQAPPNIEIVE
jgi:outer membrane lipoprotein carrier protein